MIKRRFRKVLLFVLILVLLMAAVIAWLVLRTPHSVFDADNAAASEQSAELVAQGAYFAKVADCIACHSVADKPAFAGGLAMKTPMGMIFATNITPDKETGIGNYGLADFDRALRQGVAKDGHRLYPAMPYPSYEKLSDADVKALYAFFMQGVAPAHQVNQPSTIPWPLNMRWPLALWNVAFTGSGTYTPKKPGTLSLAEQDMWNRGAYLVQSAGHCGACHTARGVAMNEKALDEGSPLYLAGNALDGWYAPSLRGDINTGLGRWSEDDIYRFLKTGRNTHAVVFGSMTDVVNNSTQFMHDEDLQSIALYLKSLQGNASEQGAPWRYDDKTAAALSSAERMKVPGAQTYFARCSFCHGVTGQGQGIWMPALAGAASSLTTDSSSQINITLNGSARLIVDGVPDAYHMPAYRDQLSDQEVAEVLSFVRASWGNNGPAVDAGAVKKLRSETHASNGRVVLLPGNR